MVMTGDHDDRVFPAHSFKYTAELQRLQAGPAPILLRVDRRAGHGAGKPTLKALEETADAYAFMAKALGMEGKP
jgi:prolyl oligopeptidase